ncbi:MAG: threonine synthase [Alphaproteobacteria bacterium]|nr:threonine synthase [Alphaproteobacteria bacterium]
MRYISTRGQAPAVSFFDAVLAGLAPDGGLYVPESWPSLTDHVVGIQGAPASDRGGYVANCGHDFTAGAALAALSGGAFNASSGFEFARNAYAHSGAWPKATTPLVQIDVGRWLLELFHGPSLSFKDVAMQLIGPLYDHILSERNERLTVICATSGDTGGAAVEALKGRDHIDLFVLLPKGRVSDVQRRFMTTSGAPNVQSIEIDGDFDACQAIVKSSFADRDFASRARLSGVNSINWARILAQSVYYHTAAHALCAHGPVHFSVPTGNFGDAFSGYVAKQMGAPVGQIMLATNANDILARAIATGRYQRQQASIPTISPAMDIQVASNFERILFEALDRDGEHVARLYRQFAQSGGFDIPAPALRFLRDHFEGRSVDDEETRATMHAVHRESGHLLCPHTAVAEAAAGRDIEDDRHRLGLPLVHLATAHPAKFPDTVEQATGVRPALPAKCADLFAKPETMSALPNDLAAVQDFIRDRSRAWS